MGGDPYGADIPPATPDWEDDETRRLHELEGGGEARERREREITPPDRGVQRNK